MIHRWYSGKVKFLPLCLLVTALVAHTVNIRQNSSHVTSQLENVLSSLLPTHEMFGFLIELMCPLLPCASLLLQPVLLYSSSCSLHSRRTKVQKFTPFVAHTPLCFVKLLLLFEILFHLLPLKNFHSFFKIRCYLLCEPFLSPLNNQLFFLCVPTKC